MEEYISSNQVSSSDLDDNDYEYLISRLKRIKEIIALLEDNF